MFKKDPFETPKIINIKEQEGREEKNKIELDEIREQEQTEDDNRLDELEEKREEFPKRDPWNPNKKEFVVARDELDERYEGTSIDDTNEFIDSIGTEKPDAEENFDKIESTNRNFLEGKKGKKAKEIIGEHKDPKIWAKMTEKERQTFNEGKQKKIEDLYIKK